MVQDSNYFFLFSFMKNTTNKSQITIPDSCSIWAKMNLEVINASNNLLSMLMTLIKYLFFLDVFFFI
jgi:hypothetical protein